jgi:hypothetical protein
MFRFIGLSSEHSEILMFENEDKELAHRLFFEALLKDESVNRFINTDRLSSSIDRVVIGKQLPIEITKRVRKQIYDDYGV